MLRSLYVGPPILLLGFSFRSRPQILGRFMQIADYISKVSPPRERCFSPFLPTSASIATVVTWQRRWTAALNPMANSSRP